MSRGKKLDLFIGGDLGSGWSEVQEREAETPQELLAPEKHFLVFKREKRRGKTVTLVGPFALEKGDAEALLKRLKKKLGSGGGYKTPWMEFQGECSDKLRTLLEAEAFRFKK
ncbi:translation initiation factor [Sulfurimonas sp. HSL-3221]|uniref:translation initiation factor n=1 Tax=Sulfurimonadaceae TaxID=2771471 RepID=UPI001E3EF9BA|nr:translation initiation factor [Sulfurimonas sp. HSL-3221]UFS61959.1 translation initiation factor [Sulfurimonas sp. HSL-3221]